MKLLYIASTSLLHITFCTGQYYDNCEIEISCPSLKFFEYTSPMPKDIVIKNLFSIEYVHIYFSDRYEFGHSFEKNGILVHKMIKEVPSISVLKLCKASLKGLYEEARQLRLSPISFYKLKSLKLKVGAGEDYMQVLILLLKYSPNLEVLKLWYEADGDWSENRLMYEIWYDSWQAREEQGRGHEVFHPTSLDKKLHCTYKMHDPEESILCLDSHLKSIQLIGFKGEENEIELLRFFLKNARVLEKLRIVWAGYVPKSQEAIKEVLNIPRTSSQVLLTRCQAQTKVWLLVQLKLTRKVKFCFNWEVCRLMFIYILLLLSFKSAIIFLPPEQLRHIYSYWNFLTWRSKSEPNSIRHGSLRFMKLVWLFRLSCLTAIGRSSVVSTGKYIRGLMFIHKVSKKQL